MEEKSEKSSGCLGIVVLLLIVGAILKQFGFGDENKMEARNEPAMVDSIQIKALVQIQDSIANKLSGTYEGALYSDVSIPAAGVHPGYTNYTVEIYRIQVDGRSHKLQSSLVNDSGDAHFKTELRITGVDDTGYAVQFGGYAYYYPGEHRICMYANSGGSVFGKDPCKFSLSGNNLVSDDGVLMKNMKK